MLSLAKLANFLPGGLNIHGRKVSLHKLFSNLPCGAWTIGKLMFLER